MTQNMRMLTLALLFSSFLTSTIAQSDFSVVAHPFTVAGFDGVQSFVSASHEGYILIIGGRKDGLHQRQPFASFLAAVDSLFIGYLVGGIESSAPNIFFINNGTQSIATNSLFRVYLKPEGISSNQEVAVQQKVQALQLSPNPAGSQLQLSFELAQASTVLATIVNYQGRIIRQTDLGYLGAGTQTATLRIEDLPVGAYLINLTAGQSQRVERFLKK